MAEQNPFGQQDSGSSNFFSELASLGSGLTQTISGLSPFLGLFPQGRDFLRSPFFQNLQTQSTGQQFTNALQANAPNLQRVPTPRIGGSGITPESIGQQGISERNAAFQQQLNQQADQQAVTSLTARQLGASLNDLKEMDRILAGLNLNVGKQLRQGMADLRGLRRDTMSFLQKSFESTTAMLNGIKEGNQEVLDNIDLDVETRAAQLVQGVTARADAGFQAHVRALASEAPLTNDEQEALRGFYQSSASSDIAVGMGQLHAAASEFRGVTAANLQGSFNNAAASSTISLIGATANSAQIFASATAMAVDLRKTALAESRMIATTRTQLKQFSADFGLRGDQTLFQMVTQQTRPVMVISDILSGVFGMAWDVTAFNNQVDQQELANALSILSPKFQAVCSAINAFGADRDFEHQLGVQENAADQALIGDIGAGIATGFFAPAAAIPAAT